MHPWVVMDINPSNLEQSIYQLASQAVEAARDRYGITLDYSSDSLRPFARLIDQAHQSYLSSQVSEQGLEKTISVWGAYLGETQRRNRRGVWKIDPEATGDRRIYLVTQAGRIYPFEQVRVRITGQEPPAPERDTPVPPPEEQKKGLSKLVKILIGVGVAAILCMLAIPAYLLFRNYQTYVAAQKHNAYETPFLAEMPNYLKTYPDPLGDDLDMQGKILIVDITTGKVADLQYSLPSEMRATTPSDLSILIQQNCFATEVNKKSESEIYARQMQCDLALIDINRGQVAARESFQNKILEDVVRINDRGNPVDGSNTGIDPQQIITWLRSRIAL